MKGELVTDNTFDFSGWASRNDIKCADGRTIRQNAFADQDGSVVPLVYNHNHDDMSQVVGHVVLENRKEGVYCRGKFNDTESGNLAHSLVSNGDIRSLSIYANKLKQDSNKNVIHGVIREVSLVLAGANPGAFIDNVVIAHSDGTCDELPEEAEIFHGEDGLVLKEDEEELEHKAPENGDSGSGKEPERKDNMADKTIKDVVDSMTEEQQQILYFLVAKASKDAAEKALKDAAAKGNKSNSDEESGEEEKVKHNVFDNDDSTVQETSYEEDRDTIIHDAFEDVRNHKFNSLKEAVIAHADQDYGIQNIDILFPDAKSITDSPEFLKRETAWVGAVISGTHHSPFSRVKSVFANITADEARARGYTKAHKKLDEVMSLLKRATTPQTIYKRQKLDRDDIIDITDFNVVAYLKGEMRIMLDEELAGAVLVGDGRLSSSDDKISEEHIRPIANDDDLFSVKVKVDEVTNETTAKALVRSIILANKDYRGSGNKTLVIKESALTNMLLIEDGIGHLLYPSETTLATTLRVNKIVEVPDEIFERSEVKPIAIVVDFNDYNIGADKGGEVNMFDDFDIDYNQMKYLMETRCSGALIRPFSALVFNTTKASEFTTKSPIKVDVNGKPVKASGGSGDTGLGGAGDTGLGG